MLSQKKTWVVLLLCKRGVTITARFRQWLSRWLKGGNPLSKRPVYWRFLKFHQFFVGIWEAFAIDEFSKRQRWRMSGFDDCVLLLIYEFLFLVGETSPQNKHHSLLCFTDQSDDGIGKCLPSVFSMGIRLVGPRRQKLLCQSRIKTETEELHGYIIRITVFGNSL